MTTGYFNCTSRYESVLLEEGGGEREIWVAAPSANGFFGAKGAASLITRAYSLIEQSLYTSIAEMGQSHRVSLREYVREGWTYHAKGLWLQEGGEDNQREPFLTIVGSTNFGERSVHRDLEAS